MFAGRLRAKLRAMTSPLHLNVRAWQAFLDGLYERDDRLGRKSPDETYSPDEEVDAYVFSGHAEALQSAEVDGDLWGTLQDIEETAHTEAEAWQKICAFYEERGCVRIVVDGTDEPEEWILSESLARRLGLVE